MRTPPGDRALEADLSAELDVARVPVHPAAQTCFGDAARELALTGGEDYELICVGVANAIAANGNLTCGAVSGTISGLSTNTIPKATGATTLGDSSITDDGTKVTLSTPIDAANKPYAIQIPNDTVTGTTLNKLAKLSGGKAIRAGTGDTGDAVGICIAGCGTSGSATIAVMGTTQCVFDAGTTTGNYIKNSGSVAGNCADAGASIPAGIGVYGQVKSTNGGGGTYDVLLGTAEVMGAAQAGGKIGGSGAANQVAVFSSGNQIAGSANLTFDRTNFRLRGQNLTTANDDSTRMIGFSGTMPTTPTAGVEGIDFTITGAGSAAQKSWATYIRYAAGYTGPTDNYGLEVFNGNAGTGATLNLIANSRVVGNQAIYALASASTTGMSFGLVGEASSNNTSAGVYGRSQSSVATGNNLGVLGSAVPANNGSTLKAAAGYFTLRSALITENISTALIADNGAVAGSMARFYDNGSIMFDFADGGTFTASRTTDLGWSVQSATNQACNTTCVSACVVGIDALGTGGFRDCVDTSSDSCICAGSS